MSEVKTRWDVKKIAGHLSWWPRHMCVRPYTVRLVDRGAEDNQFDPPCRYVELGVASARVVGTVDGEWYYDEANSGVNDNGTFDAGHKRYEGAAKLMVRLLRDGSTPESGGGNG